MADTERTAITILAEHSKRLRILAAEYSTNVSLIIRVFISYGLAHLTDPKLIEELKQEVNRERERRGAVGRKAMRSRYSKEKDEDS